MTSPFPGTNPHLAGERLQAFRRCLARRISIALAPPIRLCQVVLPAWQHGLDRPTAGLSGALERRSFYPDLHVVDSINDAHPPSLAMSAEHRAGIDGRLRATGVRSATTV
ncbi:hypothetical protein [Roseiflexus sp.]|uniref:hypothetical protein n=1 Tax=Roseiflexus sp. TaxID=2562120 RepID=UPI00398ACC0F